MLDPALIRRNPEAVKRAIIDKRTGDPSIVDTVLEHDAAWRNALTEFQQAQSTSKTLARQIGDLMRDGKRDEAQTAIADNTEIKARLKDLEAHVRRAESDLNALLLEIPNIPHESVPVGSTPDDNEVVLEHGEKPQFDFEPKSHWDLGVVAKHIDFDRGSKVTGAGFPFYVGPVARLQRSLVAYFLDVATHREYTELQCPVVVNEDSVRGTGQLPDKEDQMYTAPRDGLYLIPTAEVPVTNFHRDEILDPGSLPLKYAAWTPCFRREAGSYGKEVRGLNRLHQFDKVELVQLTEPSKSYDALESLRDDAEHLLRELRLPYRRLLMCTGDMGFTQAKKYDLEIYSAGQQRWLEVSSVSNFESFQSRRMKIRTRTEDGSTVFVHTLNGSALALPRVVAALLENGQRSDGTVKLPDALSPYFGSDTLF